MDQSKVSIERGFDINSDEDFPPLFCIHCFYQEYEPQVDENDPREIVNADEPAYGRKSG